MPLRLRGSAGWWRRRGESVLCALFSNVRIHRGPAHLSCQGGISDLGEEPPHALAPGGCLGVAFGHKGEEIPWSIFQAELSKDEALLKALPHGAEVVGQFSQMLGQVIPAGLSEGFQGFHGLFTGFHELEMAFFQFVSLGTLGEGMGRILEVGVQFLEEKLEGKFGGRRGIHEEILAGKGDSR